MRRLGFAFSAVFLAAALLLPAFAAPAQSPVAPLKVSENGRFLVHADGRPFFYLGDTAWELFHRLNREEADLYLRNRSEKGFTVIQAVVVAEMDGLNTPNAYGEVPFTDMDPARPNGAYFEHVDWIVNRAEHYGLFIGMLPTWGSWLGGVDKDRPDGNFFNETNVREYGRFLGNRYAGKPVIWVLGGDRVADTTKTEWELMASGIRESAGGGQLITFHPRGMHSSSNWFSDAAWLDFHMAQTGHSPNSTNYSFIEKDYALPNTKPCMDGEPAYEYPPEAMQPKRPVGALQVRRNAYWAVFAGAHGHTYGTHPVWQMYDTGREPTWDVVTPWHQALDLPGASQLIHLKRLMLSRPYVTRIPDQSVLLSPQPGGIGQIQVTRDGTPGNNDATYILAYLPQGQNVELDTARIPGGVLRVWWMNPRTGEGVGVSERPNAPRTVFTAPTETPGEDWVLVVDDAAKNYPVAEELTDPAFYPVTEDPALPRVLLIGDSISIGYTVPVRELLRGKANVLRIPVNGGPTARGVAMLDAWLGGGKWDVIHFNWGLHDIKRVRDGKTDIRADWQVGPEMYRANLETLAGKLKETGARLIWAATTPVPEGAGGRVKGDEVRANAIAAEVMEKHGIAVNDLHGHVLPVLGEYQRPANVHFTDAGSAFLAERVAAAILGAIEGR